MTQENVPRCLINQSGITRHRFITNSKSQLENRLQMWLVHARERTTCISR